MTILKSGLTDAQSFQLNFNFFFIYFATMFGRGRTNFRLESNKNQKHGYWNTSPLFNLLVGIKTRKKQLETMVEGQIDQSNRKTSKHGVFNDSNNWLKTRLWCLTCLKQPYFIILDFKRSVI